MFFLHTVETFEGVPVTYDICWPDWKEELGRYKSKSSEKWNRIRGYNRTSTTVSMSEGEIEDYKGILDEFIPYKKEEYFKFKELVIGSILKPEQLKGITSAYTNLIDIQNSIKSNLESALKDEEDFSQRERAWFDFMKWGLNGFFNDVRHDLENVEGFENSEYYEEAVFILKKMGLKI